MVNLDKIRKRAQAATEKAAESLQKSIEESNQHVEQMREKLKVSAEPDDAAQDGTAQSAGKQFSNTLWGAKNRISGMICKRFLLQWPITDKTARCLCGCRAVF